MRHESSIFLRQNKISDDSGKNLDEWLIYVIERNFPIFSESRTKFTDRKKKKKVNAECIYGIGSMESNLADSHCYISCTCLKPSENITKISFNWWQGYMHSPNSY